jgi:hemin uptake protein HemP
MPREPSAAAQWPIPASRATSLTDAAGAAHAVRRIAALELLGARGELVIVHAGREYRLRVTQNNKLILTA